MIASNSQTIVHSSFMYYFCCQLTFATKSFSFYIFTQYPFVFELNLPHTFFFNNQKIVTIMFRFHYTRVCFRVAFANIIIAVLNIMVTKLNRFNCIEYYVSCWSTILFLFVCYVKFLSPILALWAVGPFHKNIDNFSSQWSHSYPVNEATPNKEETPRFFQVQSPDTVNSLVSSVFMLNLILFVP